MDQNDIKNLPRNDQILLGAGFLAFIATFFPFDGVHFHGFGANENAWHGPAGVIASLCIVFALVVALAIVFASSNLPNLGVSWNVVLLGLTALGFLLYVIHALALPSENNEFVHIGLSVQWGGYVEMILAFVFALYAFMRLRDSGDPVPWANAGGGPTTPPPAEPPAT